MQLDRTGRAHCKEWWICKNQILWGTLVDHIFGSHCFNFWGDLQDFTMPSFTWLCDVWASLCHPLPRVLSRAGTAKGGSVVTLCSTELPGVQPRPGRSGFTLSHLEKKVVLPLYSGKSKTPSLAYGRDLKVISVHSLGSLGEGLAQSRPLVIVC